MTRIDELQKKYPTIPRHVILKEDVMVQGIRPSEGLDKVSEWRRAGSENYHSYNYDVTLKDLAEKEPWRAKPGLMLRPPRQFWLNSGLSPNVRLRSTSPYSIKEVTEGKFALYEGEEKVEDAYFRLPEQRTSPEPMTSKGMPVSSIMAISPCCFFVNLVRYCEYFSTGDQCKYCNFNASQEEARSVGLDIPITRNLEQTLEAYKIRNSEVKQLEGRFIGGATVKADREAKMHLDFVEKVASAASHKPNLTVLMQAVDKDVMRRFKDVGLDSVCIQAEVMDPKLFPEICPGKAKRTPHEGYMECFHNAVDIFGVGHVAAGLISGVTALVPNGHKTWQEVQDSMIEGNTYLIKNGILPSFYPLWWAPGSVFSEDKSNLEKFPPTECHLEIALAHHKAMLEYGLYEKMNKFMVCGLDLIAPYAGDIGMLTIAGDVGKWMSSVVPDEENWLAKLIAAARSPVETQ